jgi:isoleucyl-tRNA synthetase
VRAQQKELAVKLRNVYSFFTIYANIDGFDPSRGNEAPTAMDDATLVQGRFGYRPLAERALLDRWILGETAIAVREVTQALDAYLLYDAAQRARRSRRGPLELVAPPQPRPLLERRAHGRACAGSDRATRPTRTSRCTRCLVTLTRLLAPFTPYFAEELWQNLVRGPFGGRRGRRERAPRRLADLRCLGASTRPSPPTCASFARS